MPKPKHSKPMLTEKNLQVAFAYYNKAFFNNKLVVPKHIKFKRLQDEDGVSGTNKNHFFIYLDSRLKTFPTLCMIVLVHEMAHLAQWGINTLPDGHGMIYHAEIVRLFNAGAYEGLL